MGLSSLPHMLRELSHQLAPFLPGCVEWRAAWAEWKDQVWCQEFPPPSKRPAHDPVNIGLADDLELEYIMPKPNQWRLPAPSSTDITEQYSQAMRDAASAVSDVSGGFMDQEFLSGHEDLLTGYSSLFIDAENPCDDDWMNHPEATPLLNMLDVDRHSPAVPHGLSLSLAMPG